MLISFIYADTVGVAPKTWTSVPKDIYNETEPLAVATEQSSSQVSSWSQPVVESKPIVTNQTKTLDDIKTLTADASQVQTTKEIEVQKEEKVLTLSEKNWITAIETDVAQDKPIANTTPEKSWITVVDEVNKQEVKDLPLAKTLPKSQEEQTAKEDTGWIEVSQNYNETAFSEEQPEVTTKEEPVVMASTVTEPKEEIITKTAPIITSEVSSAVEPQKIEEEIIKIPEDSGSAEILDSPFNMKEYFEKFTAFTSPLSAFIKENTILSGSFLSVLGLFFYLLFYRPLSSKVRNNKFDDEIEVPQARMPQPQNQYYQEQPQKSTYVQQQEAMLNSSIITQSEYSTLYGLINETFIFEKERILLSNDITQERKNREIISLEWKFNQILHFSLPKLSTDSPKLFVEGTKELLDEEISRDIMIIALKDILEKNTLSSLQKEDLAKHIEKVMPKKTPKKMPAQNQEPNYSSYMSQ